MGGRGGERENRRQKERQLIENTLNICRLSNRRYFNDMKNTQAFTFQPFYFYHHHSIFARWNRERIVVVLCKAFIFKYLTVCACMCILLCVSPCLPFFRCVVDRLLPSMLLFNSLFCMVLFTGFCISSAFGFHFMELFGSIEFHFIAWHSICEVNSLLVCLFITITTSTVISTLPFSIRSCLLLCHIIICLRRVCDYTVHSIIIIRQSIL